MIYGFAKQSGGFVTIESAPGRGTTVRLYLPRCHAAVDPRTRETIGDAPAEAGKKILVIEDDRDLRKLVQQILTSRGYAVSAVESAAAARAFMARESPPDLVLSDVVLPGGTSGPEFIKELQMTNPDVRTVFMSGYPAEIVDKTAGIGADAVLINKPFKVRELAEAVRGALE
jgi:DNA-binding NtrC family response regulator